MGSRDTRTSGEELLGLGADGVAGMAARIGPVPFAAQDDEQHSEISPAPGATDPLVPQAGTASKQRRSRSFLGHAWGARAFRFALMFGIESEREAQTVLLLACQAHLANAVFALGRNAGAALYVSEFSAAGLPMAMFVSAVTVMFASRYYSTLTLGMRATRVFRALIIITALVLALLVAPLTLPLALSPHHAHRARMVAAAALFIAEDVLTLYLIMQASTVAQSCFTTFSAGRLLGLTQLGSSTGAVLAGLAAGPIARRLGGAAPLIIVQVVLLLLMMVPAAALAERELPEHKQLPQLDELGADYRVELGAKLGALAPQSPASRGEQHLPFQLARQLSIGSLPGLLRRGSSGDSSVPADAIDPTLSPTLSPSSGSGKADSLARRLARRLARCFAVLGWRTDLERGSRRGGASTASVEIEWVRPLVMAMGAWSAAVVFCKTVFEYQYTWLVAATLSEREMVSLTGQLYAVAGTFSSVLNMFGTTPLLRNCGLLPAVILSPLTLLCASALMLLTPKLPAAFWGRAVDLSLRWSVNNTVKGVLWMAIPRHEQDRLKPFVEVTIKKGTASVAAALIAMTAWIWKGQALMVPLSFAAIVGSTFACATSTCIKVRPLPVRPTRPHRA